LFREVDLNLYRSHSRISKLDGALLEQAPTEESTCKICLDVLAKAELAVPGIADQARNSGYEFSDFKITFSISIRANLNRMIVVTRAEQALGKDFFKHFNRGSFRAGQDFKEVFKWIVSPLLARELSVPANMDGSFHINCVFYGEGKTSSSEEESKEPGEE